MLSSLACKIFLPQIVAKGYQSVSGGWTRTDKHIILGAEGNAMPPTNKTQLHCYLENDLAKEVQTHVDTTGVPKGKLVETMWRVFTFRDLTTFTDRLSIFLSNGVSPQMRTQLQRLANVIDRALLDEKGD
jgi:hypothetical protein